MEDREKFKKEIKYTPMRSSGVIINEKEVMERKKRAREARIRQQKRQRKIKGIAAIGTIVFAGTIMTTVIPREQQKQYHKVLKQEARIRQEIANEKYAASIKQSEEYEISKIEEDVNKIELTKEAILGDVKDKYINEYNKWHEEKISTCDWQSNYQDYLYVTQDGTYITHGDYPEEVENFLDSNAIAYSSISDNTKVYYSCANGKTLEMMASIEPGKLVNVISGQQVENIQNKSDKNTLIEMKPIMDKGIQWANDPENEQLKEEYIEALETLEEKETQKSADNQTREEQHQEEEQEL